MVAHTSEEDIGAVCEGSCESCFTIVPFARGESAIACLPEGLGEHDVFGRDSAAFVCELEKVLSGHEHCPAGHADGAAVGTHDAGVSEGRAVAHEPVDVGCEDILIAKRSDSVESLVIGDDKKDIRAACFCCGFLVNGRTTR